MGKMVWREDEEGLGDTHLGCISGIFHVLDNHYWHSNVKKILPYRKHDMPIERNKRSKIVSNDQDSFEILKLFDAKTGHILGNQSTERSTSSLKRSLKHRIKALISEEILKGDKHKEQGPRLQRTYSIHHLESDEWVRPIIFSPDNEELNKKTIETQVISKESSENDTKYDINDVDLLENCKVKDVISLNVLQDDSQVYDNTIVKLAKSGSFPASGTRNMRPTMLKHKLNEHYLMPKKDKNSDDNLNSESSNRYIFQLYDYSTSKEAILCHSRSLKSTSETENSLSAQAPIFFRRIHSLPHLDDPNPRSHDTRFPISASQNEKNVVALPSSIEECTKLDNECLNRTIDRSDVGSKNESSIGEDMYGLTIEKDDDQKAHEIFTQLNPILAPEHCSEQENLLELQSSEGSESEPSSLLEENLENKSKILSTKQNEYVDDFTYVREILDRSGFIKNGLKQTWYSSNQPLDPSVFQEIESEYFHDPERFEEELIELSHHLLLFDLVDEVLLNTHELTWPTGKLVLDEAWKTVSQMLNMKIDMNQSLDSIVYKDLKTDKNWMNLRSESEGVAVELEDLIFDELVQEMLWC